MLLRQSIHPSIHLYICPHVCLYLCLSVRLSASIFVNHSNGPQLRTVHVAADHRVKFPELQYEMSVHPYVHPSNRLREFCDFCIYINFHCGGPASRRIYTNTKIEKRLAYDQTDGRTYYTATQGVWTHSLTLHELHAIMGRTNVPQKLVGTTRQRDR